MSDSEDLEDGVVVTSADIARLSDEQLTQRLGPIMQSTHFDPAVQDKINYLDQNILFSEDPSIVIYVYTYQPAEYVVNVFERIVFRINLNFDVNGAWARITKNPSGGGESFIDVTSNENCVSTMHTLLHETYISIMYEILQRDHHALYTRGRYRVSPAMRTINAQSRQNPKRGVGTRMITDLEQICNRISMIQSTES